MFLKYRAGTRFSSFTPRFFSMRAYPNWQEGGLSVRAEAASTFLLEENHHEECFRYSSCFRSADHPDIPSDRRFAEDAKPTRRPKRHVGACQPVCQSRTQEVVLYEACESDGQACCEDGRTVLGCS